MTRYIWYNAKDDEIKEFPYLAHLYLKIYKHVGYIVFLGKIKV